MKRWKIGILGAANIAFNRFLPALEKEKRFEFAGITARDPSRCQTFVQRFGGQIYSNYEAILEDPAIDCVYIPLPPALHAEWGEKALRAGKHLCLEKPFTTSLEDTEKLLSLADQNDLAVHENYMFQYHRQLQAIEEILQQGELGELRMIRTAFTFPFRGEGDFRYNAALGGGALLDCGGYPISLAARLLGDTAQIEWSRLNRRSRDGLDTGGSAVLKNDAGVCAHVFFGMDDTYRCELELWGSKASLLASRVFTAPPDFPIELKMLGGREPRSIDVPADDQFLNSISHFADMIEQPFLREERRQEIRAQSERISQVFK